MILLIRTDNPTAEVYLHDGERFRSEAVWLADRTLARDLLARIEALVGDWKKLSSIVAFDGPGSFTGLRIGITVANTLADALQIPIVASRGEDWIQQGISRLHQDENDQIVLPHYGSDPHITAPKK